MDSHLDSSDDNKPLPELSFEDFMDPEPETSGQHMEIESYTGDTSQEDDSEGDGEGQHDANDSLNTPQFKKSVVQILEDKRLTAATGAGGVFKTHAIKVVTAGANPAAKSQSSDIRILNSSLKPVGQSAVSTPLKIGSTSIANTNSPRQLGGVTMTQFKTADGRVLYLKKAPATGTGGVVAGKASVSPVATKVGTTPGTALRRVVNATGIQKAVLAKGVTVAGTGLVKATVPSGSSTTAITIKGITPLAAETTPPPTASTGTKIQVVRTADGKLIKLGQNNNSPVLLNTKAPISGASAASTPSSNMIINKSASGQVVIKPSPSSNANSQAAGSTVSGKMVVQSGAGTQIMVSTKNIIKLSPKPGATSTLTQTHGQNTPSSSSTTTPTSGMRTIQLSGKPGVQFVRVMTNNKGLTTAKPTATSTPSTSQKQVPQSLSASSAVAAATPVGNTNKIVMRTMGGSIVPLPSMKTLVPKRALGANSITAATPNSQESLRKHRLNDLNVQLKNLGNSEVSDSSDAGPETKKPRFSQPSSMQRVVVKEGGPSTSSSSATTQPKKVYNLVKSAGPNGSVKYVICNSSVARSSMSSMRRGYTGYVRTDGKLCRSLVNSGSGTTGVTTLKHVGSNPPNAKTLQAQAQARRMRQQHIQQLQKSKPQLKGSQLNQSANVKPVPAPAIKPNFEILKPPSAGTSTPAVDAQLNLASRRKHCNCSKSQCLKLYCDCFANGEFCKDCTCKDCFNNLDNEVEREKAIRSCLDRNPSAFKPKITAPASGDMRLHNKGCNCKRSGCLKNYCECYEAKIPCSSMCKCVGCRNMEDRPDVDMDSLDSLLGVRKPNKPKDEIATKKHDIRSNLYLTDDVIEATIMCMISRILMHEKQNMPIEATEREVMEELGESLNQIITFAKEKNENNTTATSRLEETTTKTDA